MVSEPSRSTDIPNVGKVNENGNFNSIVCVYESVKVDVTVLYMYVRSSIIQ